MPSIRDIAQAAAVSPATVSLVLNNRPGAARATRERVRSTAARLGYRLPRESAGVTAPAPRQQTYNIVTVCAYGVLADGELTNEARAWMAGVRESIAAAGHHVTVTTAQPHCSDDHFFRQSLDNADFHAVILLGMSEGDGYLDYVRRCGTPCVAFNRRPDFSEFSYVTMDNISTGRAGVDHLWALKHRRVAVCGNMELPHTAERVQGGIAALTARGAEPVITAPLHVRLSDAAFEEAVDALLAVEPTAVFVADWAGARLVERLHRRGIPVPDALSIIDVGDMGLSTPVGQLSSMGYDKKWAGEQLGNVAIRLIEGKPQLRCIGEVFETWVVERDTTAPPG